MANSPVLVTPPLPPATSSLTFYIAMLLALSSAFMLAGLFPQDHWAYKVAHMIQIALVMLGYGSSRSDQAQALYTQVPAPPPLAPTPNPPIGPQPTVVPPA